MIQNIRRGNAVCNYLTLADCCLNGRPKTNGLFSHINLVVYEVTYSTLIQVTVSQSTILCPYWLKSDSENCSALNKDKDFQLLANKKKGAAHSMQTLCAYSHLIAKAKKGMPRLKGKLSKLIDNLPPYEHVRSGFLSQIHSLLIMFKYQHGYWSEAQGFGML